MVFFDNFKTDYYGLVFFIKIGLSEICRGRHLTNPSQTAVNLAARLPFDQICPVRAAPVRAMFPQDLVRALSAWTYLAHIVLLGHNRVRLGSGRKLCATKTCPQVVVTLLRADDSWAIHFF